jgi:cell division septation protein DedD
MELTCPRCGAKNKSGERGKTGAQLAVCAACGASLADVNVAPVVTRRAREYDGYAVGRRILKIAPVWLLLSLAAFVLVWLFFSWVWGPAGRWGASGNGEEFKNEATNQTPSPAPRDAHTSNADLKTPAATANTGGRAGFETTTPAASPSPDTASQGATDIEEDRVFSVQVGAFADLSQANEQVSRLRAAGFEARVVESATTTRFHFQVRSGRFQTREEAAHLAVQLRAGGVAGETVIIEPERE